MSWTKDDMENMFVNDPNNSVITAFLQDSTDTETKMTNLTDRGREAMAVPTDTAPGSRVSFVTNLGTIMAYKNPPPRGCFGTVVKVRTSSGDTTCVNDMLFVKWDDGVFRPTHREHVRLSTSQNGSHAYRKGAAPSCDRFVVSSLGVLSDEFFVNSSSGTDLVHKATKDLWSVSKTEDGYAIERLFDDTGEPLKV